MDKQEVTILGGGLAGITLSILLVREGHKVLLLEKNHYPFHKVCGEYLSRESLSFLQDLGIDPIGAGAPSIDKLRITTGSGRELFTDLPLGGVGISRYRLDHDLAMIARKEGVDLREGSNARNVTRDPNGGWRIETREMEFRSKEVIGAFGKSGGPGSASSQKGKGWVAVKYHVEGDVPDDRIELHSFPGGYCGISRIEEDKTHCMAYLIEKKAIKGKGIEKAEEAHLSENATLKRYLSEFSRKFDKPLTISNLEFSRKHLHHNGIWFAGDSSGAIAPLAGNGMSMALLGSRILAPLISEVLKGRMDKEEATKRYEQQWSNTFGKRMKAGSILQHYFAKDKRLSGLIRFIKPFPALTERLIRSTHGKG